MFCFYLCSENYTSMTNTSNEIKNYYLNQASIWASISAETAAKLREHVTTSRYKKNDILYNEGFFPKGLYIVKSGIAKLQYINNEGKQQIIYILKENEMYGYRSLVLNNHSYINVTAITDCEIEIIEKNSFLNLLEESKELNNYLMKIFAKETIILFHKISFFTQKPTNERIALTLLILAYKFNKFNNGKKCIEFPKREIANFAGTILETCSRQLKILKDNAVINTVKKQIIIENEIELLKLANL